VGASSWLDVGGNHWIRGNEDPDGLDRPVLNEDGRSAPHLVKPPVTTYHQQGARRRVGPIGVMLSHSIRGKGQSSGGVGGVCGVQRVVGSGWVVGRELGLANSGLLGWQWIGHQAAVANGAVA
jgi:hypothetical protein